MLRRKGPDFAEKDRRLTEMTDVIAQQPWRAATRDLAPLNSCVSCLTELNQYFRGTRNGQDKEQMSQIKACGDKLATELAFLLDKAMCKQKDSPKRQEIFAIAKEVDDFGGQTKATGAVKQKHLSLQQEIANDYFQQAKVELNRLSSSESGLLASSRKVLDALKNASVIAKDVPAINQDLKKYGTLLATEMIRDVFAAMQSDSKQLAGLEDTAKQLDALCSKLGGDWQAAAPRLIEEAKNKSTDVLPAKVGLLEAELKQDERWDLDRVQRQFEDLAPWCLAADEDIDAKAVQERVQKLCSKITKYIIAAFDEAVGNGASTSVDRLLSFGKAYDGACQRMKFKGSAVELSKELERKNAHVTLTDMMDSGRKYIETQMEELKTAHAAAQANLNKIPAKKYDERAKPPVWRYKRRNGGFDSYSAEKSAEVEKHYQNWLAKDSPSDVALRRCKIAIKVEGPAPKGEKTDEVKKEVTSTTMASKPTKVRDRCKYGDKCYQTNESHRKRFSHPGDPDWDPNDRIEACKPCAEQSKTDSTMVSLDPPVVSSATITSCMREETYSLDFQYMTQANITRRSGLRNINRVEGLTHKENATKEYFDLVREFVRGNEVTFSKADAEMRILHQQDREAMQRQVDALLQSVKPAIQNFIELALKVGDMKTIDEILARLGPRAEAIGLMGHVKELRTKEVTQDFNKAYQPIKFQKQGTYTKLKARKWDLVRALLNNKNPCKFRLFKCRLALRAKQMEFQTIDRRRAYMRCQALLKEYGEDKEWADRFRRQLSNVLANAAEFTAFYLQPEAFNPMIKTARELRCDLEPVLAAAGKSWALEALKSACERKVGGLDRVIEVLDMSAAIAKSGEKSLDELLDIKQVFPRVAARAVQAVDVSKDKMTPSVTLIAGLCNRLDFSTSSFMDEFWVAFKKYYEMCPGQDQALACEWAIAFCEQLKISLPKWMMQKDQIEALKRLQKALESKSEAELKQAVIMAKLADYKSEAQLESLYNQCMDKLRTLKRLPSGWEVAAMVGDDAGKEKMYAKADLGTPALRATFQTFFDSTKLGILTRDRKDGKVPGGYRVESVINVMNGESWGSYLKRRDEIVQACARTPGTAPMPEAAWSTMSGKLLTSGRSADILSQCHVPPLESNANEFLLFHGTNPTAADAIAENHFEMSFACKTGLFGAGLYFAESCSKSDEYVKPDASARYPLIIARVTLGRMNYCDKVDPVKDPGRDKLEASCLRGEYHSVVGDRKKARGTYREFIVYDHYQVYPHFIVWYSRT